MRSNRRFQEGLGRNCLQRGIDGNVPESPSDDGDDTSVPPIEPAITGDQSNSPPGSGAFISSTVPEHSPPSFEQNRSALALPEQVSDYWGSIASPPGHFTSPTTATNLAVREGNSNSGYGMPQFESPSSLPFPRASIPYILDREASSSTSTPQDLQAQHIHTQDAYDFTERQAFLFMTYIHKLAPLTDACDDARHFALEVPRLALQQPMLMNGLLAIASRYDARCCNTISDLEYTYYHNKCIELLIKAFSQPPDTWDETLLTAVVIARLYEEMDNETDSYYHHLSGTQNLLNHEAMTRFVTQGGLAEAASWVHLRQTIYVYVARRQAVEICLENFERSTVFRRNDDSAYANRSVYILAKIMKLLLPLNNAESPTDLKDGSWELVEMEIDRWYDMRPVSFKPIFYKAADLLNDRAFPLICFAASVPVIAMQHYYAAKAVLCLNKCNGLGNNIEQDTTRLKHEWENKICFYLCMLMGLALSNDVTNAYYLPAHMLSLCGYVIRDPTERIHTIRYLGKVYDEIKWKTSALIGSLEKEWAEVDQIRESNSFG
ncbi:hypothetical protein NW762_014800 [Fusarium torreyae]|uniref:Uncharacterized protein n=1 Tax=Fusarium torreyae TaxID=1237075 RepID=A0A9W8RJL8_9HYPO|nr:hypothetical protein NW762_014800 [Fusarium torreyae]